MASALNAELPNLVLIVEDSPTQREALRHLLEKHDFQVEAAVNGQEALIKLKQVRPLAVIADIVMPEMDGYELCRRMKDDCGLQNIPVILLTSLSDPEDVIMGLECGADYFIMKPYNESFLLSRIQHILANRNLVNEQNATLGLEIFFRGKKYFINSDRLQILNLLLSTYETAIQKNQELAIATEELEVLNGQLEENMEILEAKNQDLLNLNAELDKYHELLKEHNNALEMKVAQRTADLQKKNYEIEQFLYAVSHDMSSPLVTIKSFVGYLSTDLAENNQEEISKDIQFIQSGADKLKMLLDELLELSRINRIESPSVNMSLMDVVTEALDELGDVISDRMVDIHLPDSDQKLFGDRLRLVQIWRNLIENAIKFSRDECSPRIELGMRQLNGESVFFVQDNGIGLNPLYRQKIFEMFEKLDTRSPGAGLGLSMVQRIVEKYSGRVWAESEGDNKGSCFLFTLPLAVVQK
jgi:two-component system, sensor histidine kinase and response regulator